MIARASSRGPSGVDQAAEPQRGYPGSYLEQPIAPRFAAGYSPPMENPILAHRSLRTSVRTLHRVLPLIAGCGLIALLPGCASEPDSHLVSAPPPPPPNRAVTTTTTVITPAATSPAYTTTSTTAPVANTIVITQTPPAPQAEVVLAQPSSQHVWIAGYWTWRNERYEWMAGHWQLPPNSGAVWVAPRWEQQGNAYKFYEGYWN